MCDSELARELRREEIEAYLAKLRLVKRGEKISKIGSPVAALYKKLLQAFSGIVPEKFLIIEKESK